MDADPKPEGPAAEPFDLARAGEAAALRAYAEAGTPAGLIDGKGDTLLRPAAYYGHAESVRVLVTPGCRRSWGR
ncbi:hypothetical protein AB0K18_25240 [Nonomuraea sp. NPDC049421]|uniref:hypothetical protein n=1 Tax=Nonomuraea sp. NPDC049421 TaxID=3155275 RepID=UPI0034436503